MNEKVKNLLSPIRGDLIMIMIIIIIIIIIIITHLYSALRPEDTGLAPQED